MFELNSVRFRNRIGNWVGLFDISIVGVVDDDERDPLLIVVKERISRLGVVITVVSLSKTPGDLHRPLDSHSDLWWSSNDGLIVPGLLLGHTNAVATVGTDPALAEDLEVGLVLDPETELIVFDVPEAFELLGQ